MNELPGLVDREARLPGVASEDAGVPRACRGREHQQSVCYPIVEEVEKSKERAHLKQLSRCIPGRQLSSLVRRGVYNKRRLRPQADYNMQYGKVTT